MVVESPSDLCLTCGLCCSGSIFAKAQVRPLLDKKPLQNGFDQIEHDGQAYFRLGCHHLEGAACSIYSEGRPRVCASFDCSLLRSWKRQEIDGAQAHKTIRMAVSLDRSAREALRAIGIPAPRNLEQAEAQLKLEKDNCVESARKRDIADALVKIFAFRMFAKKNFVPERPSVAALRMAPE